MEEVTNPYEQLIDEYAATRDAEGVLATILRTPSRGIELKQHPQSGNVDVETAKLFSTPNGRREWIRRELLSREAKFTAPKTLRIFATTWNVGGNKPSVGNDALAAWLWNAVNSRCEPDIFIIGLQEVQPLTAFNVLSTDDKRGAAWKETIESIIKGYVAVGEQQMIGIYLMVLVKKQHVPFVQNFAIAEAGTGFMRAAGNKGAVSCRFTIYDTDVCAVSAHLSAHIYNVERRNQDFHDIVRKSTFSLTNPKVSPFDYRLPANMRKIALHSSAAGCEADEGRTQNRYAHHVRRSISLTKHSVLVDLFDHDVVVWVGDLNYRLEGLDGEKVCQLIKETQWNFLAQHDQLRRSFNEGAVFQGFEEIPLNFPPTYKYNLLENTYQRTEERTLKRIPSWTDRILWRTRPEPSTGSSSSSGYSQKERVRVGEYRRHEVFSSDHRPVSAVFDVDVSTINAEKRNDIVREIHQSMKKLQNVFQPRLTISTTEIKLGTVPFGVQITGKTPLLVQNIGNLPVKFAIARQELPDWLTAKSRNSGGNDTSNGQIAPGETTEFVFTAFMGSFSDRFDSVDELRVIRVPILVQDKAAGHVTVSAKYEPGRFGNIFSSRITMGPTNSSFPFNPERFYFPPLPSLGNFIGLSKQTHKLLVSYATCTFLGLCILIRAIRVLKPILQRIIVAEEYAMQRNMVWDVLRPILNLIYFRWETYYPY